MRQVSPARVHSTDQERGTDAARHPSGDNEAWLFWPRTSPCFRFRGPVDFEWRWGAGERVVVQVLSKSYMSENEDYNGRGQVRFSPVARPKPFHSLGEAMEQRAPLEERADRTMRPTCDRLIERFEWSWSSPPESWMPN